jgi:hypothetical protein
MPNLRGSATKKKTQLELSSERKPVYTTITTHECSRVVRMSLKKNNSRERNVGWLVLLIMLFNSAISC